jgi:hypothetical protein
MDAQTQLNEAVALLIGNLTIENQALKLQLQAARSLIEQLQPKESPQP